MKGRGILGFIVGILGGIALALAATSSGLWFASPFDEIIDLRARVAEQAREIEAQRREIADQAQSLRLLDTRQVATSLTLPSSRRPPAPPGAAAIPPTSSPEDAPARTAPPSRRLLEADYADFFTAQSFSAARSIALLDLLARGGEPGIEAELRAFFPRAADYETFRAYERQLPERRRVREFRASLDRIARPLDPDQTQALITILAHERKTLRLPADPDAALAAAPRIGPRLLRDHALASQRTLAAAAAILTPEQLEVLRRLQADDFQRLKLTVEMTPSAPRENP